MRNFINFSVYLLLPAIFLGFIFWFGWGNKIFVNKNLIVKEIHRTDLGFINIKSPAIKREFSVENTGQYDYLINKIYTDCECLEAELPVGKDVFGPFGLPKEENSRPLGFLLPAGGIMKLGFRFYPVKTGIGFSEARLYVDAVFGNDWERRELLKIPIKAGIIE